MELKNIKETKNIIEEVEKGSIAQELGVEKGDILISINDSAVMDIIDYKYLMADDNVLVVIEKPDGEVWELEIEKDYDEDIGIVFTNPLIDKAKNCRNKCMFCFIDQLPKGMRRTLYFKDDDSRLSFLQGNFVTLTNMSDEEIDRIIKYRLGPINISVHTTDPDLRIKMLNNKNAGKLYDILKRFNKAGIEMNCQIVLVPGVNDGENLEKTIQDLWLLYPNVGSVAVVPIGLTKFREGLFEAKPYNGPMAKKVINQVYNMQRKFLDSKGTRFVFPSDEFYVLSGEKLLSYEEYEGFPQLENGVGLLKRFESEVINSLEAIPKDKSVKKRYLIATGTLAYNFIKNLSTMITNKVKDLSLDVIPIRNDYFGESITVSGLVTGSDLINQISNLKDIKSFDGIIIPQSMLRSGEDVFLDDYTIKDIENTLKLPIITSKVDGDSFVGNILNN